jgi:hypothetical protein
MCERAFCVVWEGKMGFARVEYAGDLLAELLHLPPETRIVDAQMKHGDIVLTIAHAQLHENSRPYPIARPKFCNLCVLVEVK